MSSIVTEQWTWYGIAMLIVTLRYISRRLQLGSIKAFQLEDYCMMAVVAFYTVLIVYLGILAHTPTNLVPPDQVSSIDPSSIPKRIYGSKITIVVEQCWCATVWGCKACLLLMYSTLTNGLWQHRAVKFVAAYVAFGYIIMEILFFGAWCRPFHNYWSVPSASYQCDTFHDHLVMNTVFNVSSDVLMLFIPLPILLRTNLPWRKKAVLVCLFSLGIFVITCALLSKAYSFILPYGLDWVFWYVREVSTAVIVANMPHCWPLVRRMFNLRSFLHDSSHGTHFRSRGTAPQYDRDGLRSGTVGQKNASGVAGEREHWFQMRSSRNDSSLSRTESEERIISGKPLEIYQQVQIRVDDDPRSMNESVSGDPLRDQKSTRPTTVVTAEV